MVLHNRHHLNASAVIKNLPENDNTFVLLRTQTGSEDVAVKPLTQFPPEPYKDNPVERYRGKYKGKMNFVFSAFIFAFDLQICLHQNRLIVNSG